MSVCIVTWLRDRRPRNQSQMPGSQLILPSSITSRSALEPTLPRIHEIPGCVSPLVFIGFVRLLALRPLLADCASIG
jgi:hypothetical protein